MSDDVLIATVSVDAHAVAVAHALAKKGVRATLWFTSDFPTASRQSIIFEPGRRAIEVHGSGLDLVNPNPRVLWNRRHLRVANLDSALPHDGDRKFAQQQCTNFQSALFHLIAPDAFCINSYEASRRAETKILQHRAAIEAGLDLPPTIYSNDPDEIRRFIRRCGGVAVFKPVASNAIWGDSTKTFLCFTSLVTESDLPDDDVLGAVPGIFQARIPKAYELRVTVMGNRMFAARVLSQDTEKGRLDWRRAYDELKMVPDELPAVVTERIQALMHHLGLVFGCIDLIVTPTGEYVFLEVNQMGQFLFVEEMAGIPLLDAFAEFLIHGRVDFPWSPDRVDVRFDAAMSRKVEAELDEICAKHVPFVMDIMPDDAPDESPRETSEQPAA